MKKYLAYYETEWPANIAELTAVENKPFVGYLKGEGVQYTVIPEPIPETRKIYYTSTDGNIVTPNNTNVFGANIVSNTYENGQGIITFDGDVTMIGISAFSSSKKLVSITIPDSVSIIEGNSFYWCDNLTAVVLPNGVTKIGNAAFELCKNLKQINMPSSLTYIGTDAFGGTALSNVVLPDSLTYIGSRAFQNCANLSYINIPNNVIHVKSYAFNGTALYNNAKENNIFYIDNCLIKAGMLDEGSVEEFSFKEGTTVIAVYAFKACYNLSSIVIPQSIVSIEEHAFHYCQSLSNITYEGTIDQWNNIVKGSRWYGEYIDEYEDGTIPAKVVHCTDGDINIK